MPWSENVANNWTMLKGKAKERWGKLTHDDLEKIDGRRDQLAARLTELYGLDADEVDRELKQFARETEATGARTTDKGTTESQHQ